MHSWSFFLIIVVSLTATTFVSSEQMKQAKQQSNITTPKNKDSTSTYVTEVLLTFQFFGKEISTQQKIMGNLTRLVKHIQEVNIKEIIKDIMFGKQFQLPQVSTECAASFFKLTAPLRNFTQPEKIIASLLISPLGKMLDAWGKIPERVLLGNVMWVGAYDECTSVPGAKYCASEMQIVGFPREFPSLYYGSCFPQRCTEDDVSLFLGKLTKRFIKFNSDGPKTKCEKPREYSGSFIVSACVMVGIAALCLIGTVIEIRLKSSTDQSIEKGKNNSVTLVLEDTDNRPKYPPPQPTKSSCCHLHNIHEKNGNEEDKLKSPLMIFFICFSLLRNSKALMCTNVSIDTIRSLNGVRVISLTWIILGHYYATIVGVSKPDNLLHAVDVLHRFTFLPVGNAYVSVDTFFLLSGLLTTYKTIKKVQNNKLSFFGTLKFYMHRYLRLTPSLALVVLFWSTIFPRFLTGPFSIPVKQREMLPKSCSEYWWSVLFYFNNFYPEESVHGCLPWSWYLANDMQFHFVFPLLLLFIQYVNRKAKRQHKRVMYIFVILLVICFISLVTTGIITGIYNIPALMTAGSLPGNPRIGQVGWVLDRIYIKPYCRIAPYLVGVFLGYLIANNVTLANMKNKKLFCCLAWVCAIIGGFIVIYGPWKIFSEGTFFNNAENILYASSYRFVWASALGWLLFACHDKCGGFVNTLLSWGLWVPLSRLTYAGYLVHVIVTLYFLSVRHIPYHYQDSTAVAGIICVTVVSYACAFLVTVCIQLPFYNLERAMWTN